jgi:hypothetical protein
MNSLQQSDTTVATKELILKFANKVIQYIPLTHIPCQSTYPLYMITDKENTANFIHHHILHYYLFFANVSKPRFIYIPTTLSQDNDTELRGLAHEIEKQIESIDREAIAVHMMGLYASETLMRVRSVVKNNFI